MADDNTSPSAAAETTSAAEAEIQSLQRVRHRLQSTLSEQLPSILEELLPKLVPLANKPHLLEPTITVISDCVKRIKATKCAFNLNPLIAECFHPSMLPYACNFAIMLVDVVLPFNLESASYCDNRGQRMETTVLLLRCLESFEAFSLQSNTVCYYLLFHIDCLSSALSVMSTGGRASCVATARCVLGDYFLDLSLLQRALSVEGSAIVGSVQPGLSATRVDRLTCKRKTWPMESINKLKLSFIELVPDKVMLSSQSVLLSILCSSDPSSEVSTQATFKMNGVANILGLNDSSSLPVIEFLLAVIVADGSLPYPGEILPVLHSPAHRRSAMRVEVRVSIMRWLLKNMGRRLVSAVKGVFTVLFKGVFAKHSRKGGGGGVSPSEELSLSSEDYMMLRYSLQMVQVLTRPSGLDDEHLTKVIVVIMKCIKKILLTSAISLFRANETSLMQASPQSLDLSESAAVVSVRVSCYVLVADVAVRLMDNYSSLQYSTGDALEAKQSHHAVYLATLISDSDLFILLFRLLEKEHSQNNESAIVALHLSLARLREAHQLIKTTTLGASQSSSSSSVAGASSELLETMKKVRSISQEPKLLVASLQWMKVFFGWQVVTIESMVKLADSTSPVVSEAAMDEFGHLKKYVALHDDDHSVLLSLFYVVITESSLSSSSASSSSSSIGCVGLLHLLDVIATGMRGTELTGVIEQHIAMLTQFMNCLLLLDLKLPIDSAITDNHDEQCFLQSHRERERFLINDDQTKFQYRLVGSPYTQLVTSICSISLSLVSAVSAALERTDKDDDDDSASLLIAVDGGLWSVYEVCRRFVPRFLSFLGIGQWDIRHDVGQLLAFVSWYDEEEKQLSVDLNFVASLCRQLQLKIAAVIPALRPDKKDGIIIRVNNESMFTAAGAITTAGSITSSLLLRTMTVSISPGSRLARRSRDEMIYSEASRLNDQLFNSLSTVLHLLQGDSNYDDTRPIGKRVLWIAILELVNHFVSQGLVDAWSFIGTSTALRSDNGGSLDKFCPGDSTSVNSDRSVILDSVTPRQQRPLITAASYPSEMHDHVFQLIRSTDPAIARRAMEICSKLCLLRSCPPGYIRILWTELQRPYLFVSSRDSGYVLKFSWAEAALRVFLADYALVSRSDGTAADASDVPLIDRFLSSLESRVQLTQGTANAAATKTSNSSSSSTSTTASDAVDKKSCSCWLLVLTKELIHPSDHMSVDAAYKLSMHLLKRLLLVFLKLLKENDASIQDICCRGLCFIYLIAVLRREELMDVSSIPDPSAFITREVINTLTREKRTVQPAGYSVAGTAAVVRDTVQHAEQRVPVGPTAERVPIDPLLQAAASAAAELGVELTFVEDSSSFSSFTTSSAVTSDYVLYSAVCNLVHRTKDHDLLFTVLSLIRRDPSFTADPNYFLYCKYDPPRRYCDKASAADKKVSFTEVLPALFHAKFDPNSVVRPVMKELWDTVVDMYFPTEKVTIIDFMQSKLLKLLHQQLSSKLWRDREAACLALDCILPHRDWCSTVLPYVKKLFISGLLILDDVRESTRGAALSFMKTLASHITRACSSTEVGEVISEHAVEVVVPLILDRGLLSTSLEAKGLSLGLLGKIVEVTKHSRALCDHLPQIVSVLVEGMSATEPQTLQYMQFHTARLGISSEALEEMRIKLSQSSPLQTALDFCLNSLNQTVVLPVGDKQQSALYEVIHTLSVALRRGVGLATRVTAAQSLTQIVDRHQIMLSSGAASLKHVVAAFQSLVWILTESSSMLSPALQSAAVSAFGAVVKVVDEDHLAAECMSLITRYLRLERDQYDQSLVLARCIQQIVRNGSRSTGNYPPELWNSILTCSFAGSHDYNSESKEVWQLIGQEALTASGVGSKVAGTVRVFPQLLEAVSALLKDLSWNRRVQGVSLFRDVLETLPSSQLTALVVHTTNDSLLANVVFHLLQLIPGRIWSGQSSVLEALSDVLTKCKWAVSQDVRSANNPVVFEATVSDIFPGYEPLYLKSFVDSEHHRRRYLQHDHHDVTSVALNQQAPLSIESFSEGNRPHQWQLSFFGCAMLFIHETQRGSSSSSQMEATDYGLSAAKALNNFPWGSISKIAFVHLVALLCRYAEVEPYYCSSSRRRSSDTDGSSALDGGLKHEVRIIVPSSVGRHKRTLRNEALFGIRYKLGKDGSKTTSAATATTTISTTSSNINDSPQVQQRNRSEDVVSDDDDDATPPEDVDIVMMTDDAPSVEDSSETILIAAADNETETSNKELVVDSCCPVEIRPVLRVPAFRVFFLESIARGWPTASPPSSSSPAINQFDQLLSSIAQDIVVHAQRIVAIQSEVWSIRRTLISVVGVIANRVPLDLDVLNAVILIFEMGCDESKFVKIKVEALKSLAMLLEGTNRQALDGDASCGQRVRAIVRKSSVDSNASVLEAVASVQNIWLR